MGKSFNKVTIEHVWHYLIIVIGIAIAFRIVISIMKVLEYWYMPLDINRYSVFKRFRVILSGFNRQDPFPDFWYNTFIGVLELFTFPIFIQAEQYSIIGAWIGFKSVAQWNAWNKNRYVFNRFLIVHALIIIFCFLVLKRFVSIDP
jgi:hypothetical protein